MARLFINSLNKDLTFSEQIKLSSKNIMDRGIVIKNKRYGIELKSDKASGQSKASTKRQVARYRSVANLKQNNYYQIFSVSEKGINAERSFSGFLSWAKEMMK